MPDLTREEAERLVSRLVGAAFRLGTLEHHPGPSSATLTKADDAVRESRAADAALAVALPILREHYAQFVHAELDRRTLHISADEIAAAIRADEGPK